MTKEFRICQIDTLKHTFFCLHSRNKNYVSTTQWHIENIKKIYENLQLKCIIIYQYNVYTLNFKVEQYVFNYKVINSYKVFNITSGFIPDTEQIRL